METSLFGFVLSAIDNLESAYYFGRPNQIAMNATKAIALLQSQKDKISSLSGDNYRAWEAQTRSITKSIFGEESHEFKLMSDFSFYYYLNDNDIRYQIRQNTPEAISIIDSFIETVEHVGIKKKEWKHILASKNPALFWAIGSTLIILAFTFGKSCNASYKSNEASKDQTTSKYDSSVHKK